jgi:hypothetical protein
MIYHQFVFDTVAETEKAFAFDYAVGYTKREQIWFPKALCGITEPNDVGNRYVNIPMWFFKKNLIDYRKVDARYMGRVEIE